MSALKQKTYMANKNTVVRKCYCVDAKDQILGRMAAKIAVVLRGKHKTTFTPHCDTGDMVIVINAEKVKVTGKKYTDKEYQRFSGYPSGQKVLLFKDLQAKSPETIVRLAVQRMIPSGPLGNQVLKKLRIFKGSEHPHMAQKPIVLEI